MIVDRHHIGRSVFGIFAIGLGVLFLLDNLNILDAHQVLHFWPAIFLVLGIVKIIQTRSVQGALVGGALMLVGGGLLAKKLGFVYFSWHTLWPVFLILLGLSVVFKPTRWRHGFNGGGETVSNADNVVDITAILGGVKRNVQSQQFRGGEITAIMGGCQLDLRTAALDGDAVLDVFALWGGIEIKVPADWTVVLQGTPILGGFEEKTLPPADKSKRLIVKGYTIMGGLEIRN